MGAGRLRLISGARSDWNVAGEDTTNALLGLRKRFVRVQLGKGVPAGERLGSYQDDAETL